MISRKTENQSLTTDILVGLDFDSIPVCKTVCHLWHDIQSDQVFYKRWCFCNGIREPFDKMFGSWAGTFDHIRSIGHGYVMGMSQFGDLIVQENEVRFDMNWCENIIKL